MSRWIARLFGRSAPDLVVEPSTAISGAAKETSLDAHQDFRRGIELLNAARYEQAAQCFEAVVERRHDLADAHYYLGLARHKQGRFEDACDAFTMASHFAPTMANAYLGLASTQKKQGSIADALLSIERAIQAGARTAELYKLRGALSLDIGNMPEAVASYEQAIALSPGDAPAHASLGYLLFNECAQYERGVWHLERAMQIDPDDEIVQCNYTIVLLLHRGDLDGTVQMCDRLLSVRPDLHEARLNRAIALLKLSRFDLAWDDYEARKLVPGKYNVPSLSIPEWQGSDLTGKTILIRAEQGLGDEIMFASCFGEVIGRAARCIIECSPRLNDLFARSFSSATVVGPLAAVGESERQATEGIDFQVAAGSLPRFLRRSEAEFPRHQGYLRPHSGLCAIWRQKLDELGAGLKIGLSWQGGVIATRRSLRSIPLQLLSPLLETAHCHFVDIQYGDTSEERSGVEQTTGRILHHWREAIDDLDRYAALVSNLDLVISVCTTVIHLAGALGRPVWIMVPQNPEWRYLAAGDHMPWYPSASMVRQRASGDWSPVIAEIARRLQDIASSASR